MKRTLLTLLALVLCLSMLLCACSGTTSKTDSTNNNDQSDTTTDTQTDDAATEDTTGDATGDKPKAVVIPKLMGIAYFDDSYVGLEAGAKDFGVDVIWDGPTEASATEQAKIAEDYLAQQDVDAILICPNDSVALETTMQKVRDAGVLAMNWDSTFNKDMVDYDIISVDTVAYGEMLFEELAKSMGGEGEYAIFTSSLDVADHNQWMEAGMAYVEKNYPDMKLVCDAVATGEDQQVAYSKTLELLNTYSDLKGIACISSVNAPGAAQAIREQGLQDSVQVVGTSLPSQVGDYLSDGSVDASVLWRPAYVTYVTMYVTAEACAGREIKDGTELTMFDGTKYTLRVTDGNVICPTDPMVFTKDNYQDYAF